MVRRLQNSILLHEQNLSPSLSVNKRMQFIKEVEVLPDDEFREQYSISDDNMINNLVEYGCLQISYKAWKCNIDNRMQPIKTMLTTAVILSRLKINGENIQPQHVMTV